MKRDSFLLKLTKLGLLIGLLFSSSVVFSESSKVLRVGTSSDYPPFSFIEKGQCVGFDIDLVQEVAKRLKYSVEIIDMPFKTLLPAIQLGTIDVIAAGLSETEERAKQVLFLPPHLVGRPFVILTKDTPITHGVSDLHGKEVVVNDGFTAAQYMQAFPDVHLQYLKTPSDALAALDANRAFAFVTSKNSLIAFFENHPMASKYHVFDIEGTGESASLAVAKNKAALFEEMKKVVLEMKQDGTIDTLQKKWGLL